jgi:aquaglyceroporin related protein
MQPYHHAVLTSVLEPQNVDERQLLSNRTASQKQQTTPEVRPQQLQHQPSAIRSWIGRHASTKSGDFDQARPQQTRSDTAHTATPRMRRTGTSGTARTNQTGTLIDASERAEKRQEQKVDVENDYFALNPWYDQQKAKPVFGLAAPLPRTVRKGMWWGRGDLRKSLYKVDEDQDDVGIDRQDALDFQKEAGTFIFPSSERNED